MDLKMLDRGLLPYEKKLRAQENFRRLIGVKEVEKPTYEKYLVGNFERFGREKNPVQLCLPNNPLGKELRDRIAKNTKSESFYSRLPYSALEPMDRIGQSLDGASFRWGMSFHPDTLPVTPPEGRFPVDDKAWMARLIKKVALFYGAEMVRITKLDQRWVYKDVDIKHQYAIVVVVSHVPSMLNTAPSHLGATATANTYSRLKFITTQLADFICNLGYDAAYRETLGMAPDILMVPLAIDAGVGEFARTGNCLSPELGVNMRMKAVTTNMPLEVDRPISFGVHDFCMACENCADYCPAGAIPHGAPTEKTVDIYNNPGFSKWYTNAERCFNFWAFDKTKWSSCSGMCLAVCPWVKNINAFHNAVRWLAIHSPEAVKKMLVWGDRKVYGRRKWKKEQVS